MSAERRRSVAGLARLRQEAGEDRAILERCHGEASGLLAAGGDALGRSQLVHLAALLHAYYNAFETLVERIARELDGGVPTGERWHEALLLQATIEIPGVRPAIVDASLHDGLHALRKFRHFFRHSYGLELDPDKVVENAGRLVATHPRAMTGLEKFFAFLDDAIESLGKPEP